MKKKILLALLSLCMICTFCSQIKAEEPDTNNVHTELVLDTTSCFTTGLNQNITFYSSSDPGVYRTRNCNRYVRSSNGSFVLYLSHRNASNYADVLEANYKKANGKLVDFITSIILGTVTGTVVSFASSGIQISLISAGFASGLSAFISSMGCLIASLSTAQRSAWIHNLSVSVNSLLKNTNTNVGVWISFNANTRTYHVGVQTY